MHGMEFIDAIRHERTEPPAGIKTLGLDRTHRWITNLGPGRVELTWPVDPAYFNLEHAVICSWTAALGDQAIFLAATTLCQEGESTRMVEFSVSCLSNLTSGDVRITGLVDRQVEDRMFASCTFVDDQGQLAARMTATLDVVR